MGERSRYDVYITCKAISDYEIERKREIVIIFLTRVTDRKRLNLSVIVIERKIFTFMFIIGISRIVFSVYFQE